jgi:hypothetical protein
VEQREFTYGGEEINALKSEMKALKYTGEAVEVFRTVVKNSAGDDVVRSFVKNEDDLLRIAEDAAGGSLDNFTEKKANWWQGSVEGKTMRIEWQPGGEKHMGHGPHVKIQEWDASSRNGTGQWRTIEKYFQLDKKTLSNIEKLKKANTK